jgi:Spy/CpxP family protein refolding chaperone
MNKHVILSTTVILILVFTGMSVAQYQHRERRERSHREMFQKHKHGSMRIPDLSDAQKEQMEKLRTEHLKTVLPLRNKMGELRAELRTLSTAESASINDINQKIDEIGNLKTQMMKEKAMHHQNIRSLLTEEQRVKFDAHQGPMGRQKGKKNGQR